ncbi:MAG: hypothetical protein SFT91_04305 [Rickettsiaceae bacterium]|nr:hypothetical protein [Rickettsiaceae bacterium]
MTLSIALDFHDEMQNMLTSNEELTSYVRNIFPYLQNCSKYPYIFHKVLSINLVESCHQDTYEVHGEVNLYIRESSATQIKNIIYLLEESVKNMQNADLPFKCISARIFNSEFLPSHDMLTCRIKNDFIATIRPRGIYAAS